MAEPSAAQQSADESLYQEGQKHYLEKRYTEALAIFETLTFNTATPSPNARLYMARCYRELGRLAEAYDEMKRTEDAASKEAATETRYAETRDAAKREREALQKRVVRIFVRLGGPAMTGLQLEINGAIVSGERLKHPIAVTPNPMIRVRASAPGFHDFVTELEDLNGGDKVDLAIALTPLPWYTAKLADARAKQSKVTKPRPRVRGRPAQPPPPFRSARGCAIGEVPSEGGIMGLILVLALCWRRAGVDAPRVKPVHNEVTHGRRAPRTGRRDRGAAAPRAALRCRQAGGRLGS